jgi:hypothetical protein
MNHRGPWTLTIETLMFKMEPWRACIPVAVDSQNLDEEQNPDPHYIEKLDRIPIEVKSWIRIRIKSDADTQP